MPKAIVSGSVVLVHGIHSRGEWYPYATTVLTPHFYVRPSRYEGYETPGQGMRRTKFGRRFLKKAIEAVGRVMGNARAREPVHVLAHSWGTMVSVKVMRREVTERFERVVLVGTPLSRTFNWKQANLRDRVTSVDNIMLTEDEITVPLYRLTSAPYVGRVASWMILPADVGGAGTGAFDARAGGLKSSEVHTFEPTGAGDDDWKCPSCNASPSWLHNWRFVGGHSSLLKRWDQLHKIVRPMFWGIRPGDYQEWTRDCAELASWSERATSITPGVASIVWPTEFPRRATPTFRAAQEKLLSTYRPFFGSSLRDWLKKIAAVHPDAKHDPDTFVAYWAVGIAVKTMQAIDADGLAWDAMEAAVAQGTWAAPDQSIPPDPYDQRFPLNPFRAFDSVARTP